MIYDETAFIRDLTKEERFFNAYLNLRDCLERGYLDCSKKGLTFTADWYLTKLDALNNLSKWANDDGVNYR